MKSDAAVNLPPNATVTELGFEAPGHIHIKIAPPGFEQTINLEEVFAKLECDGYNAAGMRQWELVFARLAQTCREKLRGLSAFHPV